MLHQRICQANTQKHQSAKNETLFAQHLPAHKPQQLFQEPRIHHEFDKIPLYSSHQPSSVVIQPQLQIGTPGNRYEQEADTISHQVIQRLHAPAPQRIEMSQLSRREPLVQPQSITSPVTATPELESSIQQAQGRGLSLAQPIREPLEHLLGANFKQVKVHVDAQADQLNCGIRANAFTVGQDIFFRRNQYQPETHAGQKLIAHELVHVMQQSGGNGQAIRQGIAGGVIQRDLKDDQDTVDAAKEKMLESRTPLDNLFRDYSSFLKNYKKNKPDSAFRENSAQGLKHWAEHFDIGAQGSLSELRRIKQQLSTSVAPNFGLHSDATRKARLGVDNTFEPDIAVTRKPLGATRQHRAEEIKGISTAAPKNVDDRLRDAMDQLEESRANTFGAWKAIVYITHPANPWPFDTILDAQGKTAQDIEDACIKKIKDLRKIRARSRIQILVNGINQFDAMGDRIGNGDYRVDLNLDKADQLKKNRTVTGEQAQQSTNKKKKTTFEYPQSPIAHPFE